LYVLRQRPSGGFARRAKRRVVLLDHLIEQRLLGLVPRVARRIDERRHAPRGRAAARHCLRVRAIDGLTDPRATRAAASRFPGEAAGFSRRRGVIDPEWLGFGAQG
jgi:hypothetical protein